MTPVDRDRHLFRSCADGLGRQLRHAPGVGQSVVSGAAALALPLLHTMARNAPLSIWAACSVDRRRLDEIGRVRRCGHGQSVGHDHGQIFASALYTGVHARRPKTTRAR